MSRKFNSNGVVLTRLNYKNVDETKLRKPTDEEIKLFYRMYEYLLNNQKKNYNIIKTVSLIISIIGFIVALSSIIKSDLKPETISMCVIFVIIGILFLLNYNYFKKTTAGDLDLLNNIKEGLFKILDLKSSEIKIGKFQKDFDKTNVDLYYQDDTLFLKDAKTFIGGLKKDSTVYLFYSEYKMGNKIKIRDDIVTPYMLSDEGYKYVTRTDYYPDIDQF